MLRTASCLSAALSILTALPALAANAYIQHNLAADTPGIADFTDPNLINPWGLAISSSSPFWMSLNGTGLAVVYGGTGSPSSTRVQVPPGAATTGTTKGPITGQIANTASAFAVQTGRNANFLFCTEDGTVSGWNAQADATHAIIKVDNSSKGAVYMGCTLGGTTAAPQLYVANFNSGQIEVYDGNFAPVTLAAGAFTDPSIPTGYAPFNIWTLNGKLYVPYAKQDASAKEPVAGIGNGFVDVYNMDGTLSSSLAPGAPLNAPWGVAIAPPNFGDFSGMVLVGNFGNGRINVYNPTTGASLGPLQDTQGNAIAISGLWALQVGNGRSGGDANAVYFTAGPGGEQHGLFGLLQAGPVLATSNPVVNGASFQAGVSQLTWVTIFGSNMSSTTRSWTAADIVGGKLPTKLDGVTATIDGKPAYLSYVSPTQINALVAADQTLGPVSISTANQGLVSNTFTATMQATSPAFFISKNNYVAGFRSDNKTILGPTTLFANSSAPAQPGETIVLYANGFGSGNTPIPDGQVIATPIPITGVSVTIGSTQAQVVYSALVAPGLYQFNVIVPASVPDGDAQVVASIGGAITPTGPVIAVLR